MLKLHNPFQSLFKHKAADGPPVIDLLVFIVDWPRQKLLTQAFEKAGLAVQYTLKGRGTASREILDLLGIGATDKAVLLSLEEQARLKPLLKIIAEKAGLWERGAGVAFSVPLSGINSLVMGLFSGHIGSGSPGEDEGAENESGAAYDNKEDAEGSIMETKKRSDLVMCILNQGYSDEFMAEARKAGAGGGTVLSARGLSHKSKVKFFGISVQDEKEIILILSTHEKRDAIMSAVSDKFGVQSEAEGIVFAVPADNITGIELR